MYGCYSFCYVIVVEASGGLAYVGVLGFSALLRSLRFCFLATLF